MISVQDNKAFIVFVSSFLPALRGTEIGDSFSHCL